MVPLLAVLALLVSLVSSSYAPAPKLAVADEMGWKLRSVSSDRTFIEAIKNRAMRELGPGILNKVEFAWIAHKAPIVPPLPLPGAKPFVFKDSQGLTETNAAAEIIK